MKCLREVHIALFELMIECYVHHLRLIAADLTRVSELAGLIVIDCAAARLKLVISPAYLTLRELHSVV